MRIRHVLLCITLSQAALASFLLAEDQAGAEQGNTEQPDTEALAYNETVVAVNLRLQKAGAEYGEALMPVFRRQVVDARVLKRRLDHLHEVYDAAAADMKKAPVLDSDVARAFQQAQQKYLDLQKSLIEDDLAQVGRIIEDATLTAVQKEKKVEAVMEAAVMRDSQVLQELVEAQKEYAAAYRLAMREYTVWVFRRVNGRWVKQEDRTLVTRDPEKARKYAATVKTYDGWTATSNIPEQ